MDLMSELIAAAAILTPIMVLIGAMIYYQIDRSISELKAEQERVRKELRLCHLGRGIRLTVIELLWQALARLDPNDPTLSHAKDLLERVRDYDLAAEEIEGLNDHQSITNTTIDPTAGGQHGI